MSLLVPTVWDVLATFCLSAFWLGQVMKYVPEPYLDEVFHIPQAQAYCRGEYGVWDPKLTTPPGLYAVSALFIGFLKGRNCTVTALRMMNCLALAALQPAARCCRSYIRGTIPGNLGNGSKDSRDSAVDWDAIHTAVNICLFPPIFFFSGLYYTDVLSTCIVIAAYYHFLQGEMGRLGSVSRGAFTYLIGVMALLMRQTNIFWVAVFMGGLEVTRTFDGKRSIFQQSDESPWKGQSNNFIFASKSGAFHDPKLEDAGLFDYLWCAASLGAAIISNPRRVAGTLWPYVALLVSFAGFVLWNGGVVLGDKSNHVATIHLPQMLYIWPFMAFFSLPLLYPSILEFVVSFLPFSIYWPENLFGARRRFQTSTVVWLLGSMAVAIGVVHFNTIIHPFTLADNRHYVFYVFRYTIRRHPLVKYALVPFYIICSFLALRTLAGSSRSRQFSAASTDKTTAREITRYGKSTSLDSGSPSAGPSCSFALIWLVSTALSLITAPLVEPRYFIIPWVIWRLHIPALPLSSDIQKHAKESKAQAKKRRDASTSGWAGWTKYWVYKGHDCRLWVETVWFLLISLITGCLFLFRGFEWPQEPGKVQRFMW